MWPGVSLYSGTWIQSTVPASFTAAGREGLDGVARHAPPEASTRRLIHCRYAAVIKTSAAALYASHAGFSSSVRLKMSPRAL